MRKIYSILLTLGIFTFLFSSVFASQGPPSPVCEIEADILKIGSALDDVNIKIIAVHKMVEEGYQPDYQDFTCDSYNNKTIESASIRSQGNFKVGQKIRGKLSYFIDEFTPEGAMVLDDVIIISEPSENTIKEVFDNKNEGEKQINYIYYLIPGLIILFAVSIYLFLKKKR